MSLSRRRFIELAGKSMTAFAMPQLYVREAAAQTAQYEPVIVVLFLRGGADALMHLVPSPLGGAIPAHRQQQLAAYATARPTVGLTASQVAAAPQNYVQGALQSANAGLPTDFFAVNSDFSELFDAYYASGDLAVVHACGNTQQPNYSHFTAQESIDRGVRTPFDASSGWLVRAVDKLAEVNGFGPEFTPLSGISVSPKPIASLLGGQLGLTLALSSIENLALPAPYAGERESALSQIYGGLAHGPTGTVAASSILRRSGDGLFHALSQLSGELLPSSGLEHYEGAGLSSVMRDRLADAARLIKQPAFGVRAVAIDYLGNWDFHTGIVSQTKTETPRLAAVLKRFYDDLSDSNEGVDGSGGTLTAADRTVTVVVSEFGRVVRENGLGGSDPGTDHGHGGAMYVMGGGVRGGRVLCRRDPLTPTHTNDELAVVDWPGLEDHDLHMNRDLRPTIDFRDVFAEVIANQFSELSSTDITGIFSSSAYTPVPLPDGGLFASET